MHRGELCCPSASGRACAGSKAGGRSALAERSPPRACALMPVACPCAASMSESRHDTARPSSPRSSGCAAAFGSGKALPAHSSVGVVEADATGVGSPLDAGAVLHALRTPAEALNGRPSQASVSVSRPPPDAGDAAHRKQRSRSNIGHNVSRDCTLAASIRRRCSTHHLASWWVAPAPGLQAGRCASFAAVKFNWLAPLIITDTQIQ